MRRIVLAVTVSMLALVAVVSRSPVVQAQVSQGTFTFTVQGSSHTTTTVDAFAEVTNVPAGTWSVDVTKDVDATTPSLFSVLATGKTLSSARVTIAGVTRRFQNGQIMSIQPVAGVVPREKVSLVFNSSSN